MTPQEVESVASEFIKTKHGRRLKIAAGARRTAHRDNEWTVVFLYAGPNGEKFDGPIIVVVDDKSGVARFWT